MMMRDVKEKLYPKHIRVFFYVNFRKKFKQATDANNRGGFNEIPIGVT